ncbi:uncharacterized protein AB675_12033 [Cyphellophora attinorum]|uniref:Uncharacterized protein n=1 Tax=Cyphellophora attinorum TaxID=1664694 RepID=A0A0N1H8N7_9EURO|nr:uncharacterized protein AB675_12033 [Phialophora attinorum]KPI38333.1 hypothetical protein AB675_12033 [Phialophora attinorum]
MASLFTETITSMSAVFTPPANCLSSWTFEDEFYNSVPGGLLMQNIEPSDFDIDCWPEDFGGYGRAPSSIQVYSPGWCPEGYATPGQFQADGTTTAICCPSSFSYGSTYSSINFFGSSSVLFAGCLSQFSGTTTVSARGNDSAIPVSGSEITMWAQPISVEYQERDLSLFDITTSAADADTTTSGGGVSKTATLPSNTVDSPGAAQTSSADGAGSSSSADSGNDNTVSNTASSSISTGAIAGIAVGAAIVAIAALAALWWFIWRKRRNARLQSSSASGPFNDSSNNRVSEMAGSSAYYRNDSKEPYRHQAQPRGEMDGGRVSEYRPELDGGFGAVGGRRKQGTGEFSELP